MGYVGDWRPHKPRGPIGAHFKSPGPKYSLPSTVGRDRHDGRKKQAPAFSFGTRHAKFSSDCSPGPGAYSIVPSTTRRGGDGTPKYSLYGRHKELRPFSTPGPGKYSPEQAGKSAYYSAPTYSLSGRTKGHKSDQSPAPNTYSLLERHNSRVKSAPKYSFGSRQEIGHFTEDLAKTPGPAVYSSVDPSVFKRQAAQYSMTARNSLPGDRTTKPGPGAHSPEKVTATKRQNASYSFGIRHSEFTTPIIAPADV
jgi:hypothetical protein